MGCLEFATFCLIYIYRVNNYFGACASWSFRSCKHGQPHEHLFFILIFAWFHRLYVVMATQELNVTRRYANVFSRGSYFAQTGLNLVIFKHFLGPRDGKRVFFVKNDWNSIRLFIRRNLNIRLRDDGVAMLWMVSVISSVAARVYPRVSTSFSRELASKYLGRYNSDFVHRLEHLTGKFNSTTCDSCRSKVKNVHLKSALIYVVLAKIRVKH